MALLVMDQSLIRKTQEEFLIIILFQEIQRLATNLHRLKQMQDGLATHTAELPIDLSPDPLNSLRT